MMYRTRFTVGEDCKDINEALTASRALPYGIMRTIRLSGEISLTEPILLDGRDSGLTIEGGALSGSTELTEWERDPLDSRFLRAKLPSGAEPRTLIVNGRQKSLSVYPDGEMLQCLDRPENLNWMGSVGGGWNRPLTDYELHHMQADPSDLPKSLLPGSTEVKMYHSWDESTVPVSACDRATGLITFASELGHPAGAFDRYNYRFMNLRDGMTRPGIWYTDLSEGWIYYYPEKEDGECPKAVLPITKSLIRISNASNVTLSNIELSSCATDRVISGLRSANLGGAVEISDSESISLCGLYVHDCTGNGIKILNSRRLSVSLCRICSMGAGGIFTHGCGDEQICHNRITDVGLSAFSSIGIHAGGRSMLVWVLEGKPEEQGHTLIRGNFIKNAPYCGITCNGGPHLIEQNVIEDCMQKLNDGGAIYVSRGNGTVLRSNSATGSYTGHQKKAYYFDEGGHNCLCECNESFGIETPYGDHRCENMTLRGNHFSCGGDVLLAFANCIEYDIYQNVICAGKRFKIEIDLPKNRCEEQARLRLDKHFRFKDNIIHSCSPTALVICADAHFDYEIDTGEKETREA